LSSVLTAARTGQALDRLKLTKIDGRKRLADRISQCFRVDGPQEAAGQTRGELPHGHDLQPALPRARRLHPDHVPGELCVHDDCPA
jgi:hypothetical protein